MASTIGQYVAFDLRSVIIASGNTLTLQSNYVVVNIPPLVSGDDLLGMTPGTDGRIVILMNGSKTKTMDIIGESAGATAADRFADAATLDPDTSQAWVYDGAISRWVRFL